MEITLGWKRLAVLAVVAFGLVGAAFAAMTLYRTGEIAPGCSPGRTISVAPDQKEASHPKIWEDWVVWQVDAEYPESPNRLGDDIFSYEIPTGETRVVADGPALQTAVEVYDGLAVWREEPFDGASTSIRAQELASGNTRNLAIPRDDPIAPRGLYGDRVLVEASSGLYVFNLSSEDLTQITDYDPGVVEIWDDRIVWVRNGNRSESATFELVLHDLSLDGSRAIDSSNFTIRNPDIYEDTVVYEKDVRPDDSDGGIDLFAYNLRRDESTSLGVTSDENEQDPRLAGDWVMYKTPTAGGYEARHLKTRETVRVTDFGQVGADIWRNRAVYAGFEGQGENIRQVIKLHCLAEPS